MPVDRAAIGREMVQRRRLYDGLCKTCGKPFRGYNTKRYCSPKCQVRDYRRRAKGS